MHLYEERGPRLRRAAAGHVRVRPVGPRSSAGWCWRATGSGSSRSTTGSRTATLSFASELKALLRQPGFSREVDLDALEAFLAFNSIPAPLTIFAEARKLPAGHLLVCERGDVSVAPLRAAAAGPAGARSARETEDGAGGRAARAPARLGARPPRRGRAGRRAAVGRRSTRPRSPRWRRARAATRVSTFSIGFEERSFNELERARLVARAVRHRPPRADRAARRRRAAAEARRGVRRAVRGLVGAAHLPGLAARRRHRQGRALGRGRRRAVRRLLHLRRGHARPARRPARERAAARWSSGCPAPRPRSSFDYKREALRARRRICRRSSAITPGRRSSRPRRAPRCSSPAAAASSTRSTSTAPATRRRRARTSWRGSRTSTPGSTWSTTCW